jgi:chitinase
MSDNLAAGVTCYITDCNVDCKTGTNEVTQMDGQPNQISTNAAVALASTAIFGKQI